MAEVGPTEQLWLDQMMQEPVGSPSQLVGWRPNSLAAPPVSIDQRQQACKEQAPSGGEEWSRPENTK